LKKNQIVNPLNKLFSNPFGKKSAIVQDSFVHPVPAQVVSPDSSPDWCLLIPYTKNQLEYERQQVQGILYASRTPFR